MKPNEPGIFRTDTTGRADMLCARWLGGRQRRAPAGMRRRAVATRLAIACLAKASAHGPARSEAPR